MAAAEVIDQSELLEAFESTKEKFSMKLPRELYEKDAALGVRILVKTFSLVALGVLFTMFMPAYLSPVGMLLTGCGMSMLYLVGYQCKNYVYFDTKMGNSVARELANLFLMEGWISCTFFVVLMSCLCYYLGVCFFYSSSFFLSSFFISPRLLSYILTLGQLQASWRVPQALGFPCFDYAFEPSPSFQEKHQCHHGSLPLPSPLCREAPRVRSFLQDRPRLRGSLLFPFYLILFHQHLRMRP